MLLARRFLLPARRGAERDTSRFRLDDYFTELTVLPGSPFLDETVADVEKDDRLHFHVVGRARGRRGIARTCRGRPAQRRSKAPLAAAMKKSGASELLAGWLQAAIGGWSQVLVLAVLSPSSA